MRQKTRAIAGLWRSRRQPEVIPRGACYFRCFDLTGIPRKEQRDVLQLQVLQWAPVEPAAFNIVWMGAQAQVWCWSPGEQAEAATEAGRRPAPVAESRLYPSLEGDGVQLQACKLGFEARVWKAGVLIASHWWQDLPGLDAFTNFERAAGLRPSGQLPALLPASAAAAAWGRDAPLNGGANASWEKPLWMALLFGTVFGLAWYGWQIYQLTEVEAELQTRRIGLETQIEPLLRTRNQALNDRARIVRIRSLWADPGQLQLLEDVVTTLPKPDQMQIVGWDYYPGLLTLTVAGKGLDPSILVRAFSKLPWARDVTAKPIGRSEQMEIRMNIEDREGGGRAG